MSIQTYYTCHIIDTDTARTLEEGDNISIFKYYDETSDSVKTLYDVYVCSIQPDDIEIIPHDHPSIIINIDDIIYFE